LHRFRLSVLFFSLVALTTVACCHQQKKPEMSGKPDNRQTESSIAAESDTYKIRLVFDGLVTFVTPDRSTKPGKFWVLVGNATEPGKLKVGTRIAPHENHLMIEHAPGVRISGRILDMDGTHVSGLDAQWKGISLSNEDLRLVGDLRTSLSVVRGTGRPPHPCIAGSGCTPEEAERQAEDFEWTIDVDAALAKLRTGTPEDRQIKDCLLEDTYSCRDEPLLLSGRFKLENGRVFVQEHYKQGSTTFVTYDFGDQFSFEPRAVAKEVAVEIEARGPIQLVSTPLQGTARTAEPIVVEADPGKTVFIRIGNHAICDKNCTDGVSDFLFNFNLLNNPMFIKEADLPVPQEANDGDPNFDPQCSPGSFKGGGGTGEP